MADLISISILTRNAGEAFPEVLAALRRQVIDLPTEIVLLDNGSTDGTLAVARAAGAVVHTMPPEDFSFGESRDRLFSLCRGPYIVALSQDAVPADDHWLDRLTRPLRDGTADIVQGLEVMADKPFFWDRIGRFYYTREWQPFFACYGAVGLSTANLATTRAAWERARFGPIAMCSDKLFQKRAAEAGLRVVLCREARVRHGHTYTTAGLFKRCANEGMGLRMLGFRIATTDALRDLAHGRAYRRLLKGLLRREVHAPAEVLFPLIRPAALWYGNRFLKSYWR